MADIMVVDDTPANLDLLTEMLRTNGYKVRPVTSGAQALRAAQSEVPDLILLDILMPEMDGYEVGMRLKEDNALKDVPVIFLSALTELEDKVRGLRGGGNDYITKPFQSEEVLARIEVHLGARRQKQELMAQNELLKEKVRSRIKQDGLLNTLSAREREILHWVGEGKRNSEIAQILNISAHTVRHHLENVFGKLGVETRTAAIAILGNSET
ncbi:MAG: response regulator [Verrucomicrobiota bacterium]